ncbi:MAG: high frequency lysogenization protein HflD [Gammaproteobacteria bacterium]|nr:MAG: high frequency lysogenization protein HflD [Gammaproteobacteria bacterium]
MPTQERDRVIALAGMFQSARLVQQLARKGYTDDAAFVCSINSILKLDADDTESVYGGLQGLRLGLQTMRDKLGGDTDKDDLEMARYVIGVAQLERKLSKDENMLHGMSTGIATIQSQMDFFQAETDDDSIHPNLIAKLAELYKQTLSTITPRIVVQGEQAYLSNSNTADKVRACLLAGVRSAVLWRQLGGRRWQLLFRRSRISEIAHTLLQDTDKPAPSV